MTSSDLRVIAVEMDEAAADRWAADVKEAADEMDRLVKSLHKAFYELASIKDAQTGILLVRKGCSDD